MGKTFYIPVPNRVFHNVPCHSVQHWRVEEALLIVGDLHINIITDHSLLAITFLTLHKYHYLTKQTLLWILIWLEISHRYRRRLWQLRNKYNMLHIMYLSIDLLTSSRINISSPQTFPPNTIPILHYKKNTIILRNILSINIILFNEHTLPNNPLRMFIHNNVSDFDFWSMRVNNWVKGN